MRSIILLIALLTVCIAVSPYVVATATFSGGLSMGIIASPGTPASPLPDAGLVTSRLPSIDSIDVMGGDVLRVNASVLNPQDLLARDMSVGAPGTNENSTLPGTGNDSAASAGPHLTTAQNNTAVRSNNTSAQGSVRTPTRHPRIDPRSTKDQIQNMSVMQRLYRNAFIGSTMHKAYEGNTQYPTWIDPYDGGHGVFNQPDMYKIMDNARALTQPGKHLYPALWAL